MNNTHISEQVSDTTLAIIWDLENEEALIRDEFLNISASPWTQWIRIWYTRKLCTLYKQIYPEI